MNYKVFKRGNYIIIIDDNGKYIEYPAATLLITKANVDSNTYNFRGSPNVDLLNVPFANIKDVNGDPYPSETAWEDFYSANIGQVSGSNGLTDAQLRASPLQVTVTNPTDLTAVQAALDAIKNFAQSIEENTDTLEAKLDTINSNITTGDGINHSDLISVITHLTTLESYNDGLEPLITDVLAAITNTGTDYIEFGSVGNIPAALDSTVEFIILYGHSSIGFHLIPPSGGKVRFEGTFDGINWIAITFREIGANGYTQVSSIPEEYIGSISCLRKFRVKVITAGSGTGTIIGKMVKQVSTIEGSEHASAPHLFGFAPVHKDADFTIAETLGIVWTPTTGKKFVVTDYSVSAGTVTGSATITLFDGANESGKKLYVGRTSGNTYHQQSLKTPFVSSAQNNVLRYASSGIASVSVVAHGYEID